MDRYPCVAKRRQERPCRHGVVRRGQAAGHAEHTHYTDYDKARELVDMGELRDVEDDGTPDQFNDPWPPVLVSRAWYRKKGGAEFNYLYVVGAAKPWRCVKGMKGVDAIDAPEDSA